MRYALPVLIASLAACGPSTEPGEAASDVSLTVDPGVISPGDSIELTLTNRSASQIGYNLCNSPLQRRDGSSWEPVPSDQPCTMELRILEPDGVTRYAIDVPTDLAPGEYRFVTTVEYLDSGERVGLPSDAFSVGR